MADKVSYSSSMKIGLPEYSSVSFNVGFESSVEAHETTEEAFARVKAFVDERVEEEVSEVEKLRPKK